MKRKTLKFSPEYDFMLIGVSASINDIRLAYILKTISDLEFQRCEYLSIYNEKALEPQKFSLFENIENDEQLSIYLVGNKSTEGYLIEELKNIDYFIMVKGSEKTTFTAGMMKELKKVESLQAVFQIDPQSLQSKQKLLI